MLFFIGALPRARIRVAAWLLCNHVAHLGNTGRFTSRPGAGTGIRLSGVLLVPFAVVLPLSQIFTVIATAIEQCSRCAVDCTGSATPQRRARETGPAKIIQRPQRAVNCHAACRAAAPRGVPGLFGLDGCLSTKPSEAERTGALQKLSNVLSARLTATRLYAAAPRGVPGLHGLMVACQPSRAKRRSARDGACCKVSTSSACG